MKVSELKTGYYLFGNKGTVWSNNAHIAKSGSNTTLCGTPMLSTNWAQKGDLENANCKECNHAYKGLIPVGRNNNS